MAGKEIKLGTHLDLEKCPHCSISHPSLNQIHKYNTKDHLGVNTRRWKLYICRRCGGSVTAHSGDKQDGPMEDFFPNFSTVNQALPIKAKSYLEQAYNSIHAPSGCVMLCASAVDEMLKQRGYKEGKLYSRINQAAEDGVLTTDMETWAHEIRLDANDERHADENASLPNEEDAKRALNFTDALAEYLFVLPSKVKRGIKKKKPEKTTSSEKM